MSAPHLLLRRLPKVLRKEALRQKELDSFVSNYPLSDFIDFSLDTGGPITIGPRQGVSVAHSYDVELIWVLLLILENHFPIVADLPPVFVPVFKLELNPILNYFVSAEAIES